MNQASQSLLVVPPKRIVSNFSPRSAGVEVFVGRGIRTPVKRMSTFWKKLERSGRRRS